MEQKPNQIQENPTTPDPNSKSEGINELKMSRRLFNKAIAVFSIGLVADQAAGGALEKKFIQPQKKLDTAKNSAGSNIEKSSKTIDYLGTLLFASGIRSLMPGGKGHIDQTKYASLAALTSLKYQLSNSEEKEHLIEEIKSNARAFVVINGTIAVAEGLNFDMEETYQNLKGKNPEDKDKIALMTTLASCLSPAATTVGSASIVRKMSTEFASLPGGSEINTDMANIFISHVSNISGFLLFGDPPFIAICEKYGFTKGIEWQLQTMWPMALYSLLSATVKLNYQNLKNKGQHKNLLQNATTNAISGILKNIPLIASIVTNSLINTAKYFTPAGLILKEQSPNGIEVKIGEVLFEKIKSLSKLPFDPALDQLTAESFEGLTRDHHLKKEGAKNYLQGIIEELYSQKKDHFETPEKIEDAFIEIHRAIDQENWPKLSKLSKEIPNLEIFINVLKDFLDNEKIDHSPEKEIIESTSQKIRKIWTRTFDISRMGNALGHNMRDVVNVFPFQAGCVPFLVTAFKDGVDFLNKKGVSEKKQEIMIFFAIMAFSSVADNYVACKIGLELYPQKPHLPLIASIVGGSLSSLGNMANVAQFNLQQYPFVTSIIKDYWQLDMIAASLIWKETIDWLNSMGLCKTPQPTT